MKGWQDERVSEPRLCPLCKCTDQGGHRKCLCDLKARPQNVHSLLITSVLQSPATGCCSTGLAPAWCHGQCLIATFLPGSKALCTHTCSGSLRQGQGPYYLPRHNAPTWTSNTFLWLDGSIMQSRAPFRSIPWALLFMTCFFILGVKE